MTPERHKQIKSLFLEVCELNESQREAVLDSKCGDDADLRAAVERMVIHDSDPKRLEENTPIREQLDGLFRQASAPSTQNRTTPDRIGKYRTVETIGEGGFGTVYKAEQAEPVRRTVAVKVIKPGMGSRQVISRFMAERQALALMDHPGIARIFEAGETESGQPYLVMEWIQGSPITRYCDQHNLSPRERLQLFIRVCQAVQYAHQKGVIHRDIKPSNILVVEGANHDGIGVSEPIPKIIDFGIAKALDDALGAHTLFTEHGQMIGTPEYMSPEQASGVQDIDTRTDIYSLGVLLYELMTGTTPLDRSTITEKGFAEFANIQRAVCEVDPPTPSSRLKTLGDKAHEIARHRRTDTFSLTRLLRGDLDWIVMKAIEKDRERRYESASSLAVDVQRHLDDDTVIARPPTVGYRFAKFARRNSIKLAAAAAVTVALIGGGVVAAIGWRKSITSEARAHSKADIAQAVNDFLNDDLLGAVSPDALGNDVRMRKVVELASDRLQAKFKDQPEVEAAIRLTLGRTFRKLADVEKAIFHLERCRDLRAKLLGSGHADTLDAVHELGLAYAQMDRNAEAETALRTAYEGRKKLFGVHHRDTISSLYELSVAIGEQGRFPETEQLMTEALRLCREHLGNNDALTITVIRGVGVLYWTVEQPQRAGPLYEEAYNLASTALGLEHPVTLLIAKDLAGYYIHEQRWEQAEALLSPALFASQRVRGNDHPATLMIMSNLAGAYHGMGRDIEAEALYLKAIETATATLPPGHTVTNMINGSLAEMYVEQRNFEKAEPLMLATIKGLDRSLGPSHPFTLRAIRELISVYKKMGEEAKELTWKERISNHNQD